MAAPGLNPAPDSVPRAQHTSILPSETVFDPRMSAPAADPARQAVEQEQRALLVRVYGLMCLALGISAAVAFWAANRPQMQQFTMTHAVGVQLVFLLEIVSVAFIARYVDKLDIPMLWVLYFFYSAFNGLSFGVFFLWFEPTAVAFGFLMTGFSFGAIALYGFRTGQDVGSGRNLLAMGALGFCSMVLVNLALGHSDAYYGTATLGIIAFTGLTAYHIQDIRDFEWQFEDDDPNRDKAALIGALLIYLDFVNLYMMVMRMFAQSRNPRTTE